MTGLKPFLIAITGAAVMLQLLILANMSYLYGTAYHNTLRYSALKFLFVDYDGGEVGQSVMAAYNQMRGPEFPTLHQHSPAEYPAPQDVQEAVCKGGYWGAIYSSRDASSRLSAALASSEGARDYDSSQALGYIWSSARYPSTAQAVSSMLDGLAQGAAAAYRQINGTAALATINVSDPSIAQAILSPISASSTDLNPMPQGTRFYYNTVSMVMPIIIQFFFIMALNGIWAQNKPALPAPKATLLRFGISLVYTCLSALVMTGYIWSFRESWPVTGSQFARSWMAIWLASHIHFMLIDFVIAIIPMQFAPFFVLTWVILNVSSTISPFELSPGVYRLGYVMPAHELYEVLLQIWTEGCNPHLGRALGVLFAEWVVGVALFVVAGVVRRGDGRGFRRVFSSSKGESKV
ncbi:hypothetical protein BJX68DRAFT_231662 [Aspergillus pseudodeflectus]|uniref:DUF3533 domain-containing protein n=1 Tax=Aspergillus pseudodeflectus TaxID=176178 RepID=A0ABR4KSA4_9EURO